MDTYITLKTFTYPSEAYILRGKLESEGISCFLQDELTVQSNPLYSNAVGGVKLQVKEADLSEATSIMLAGGYQPDTDSGPPKFYTSLAKFTSAIPFISQLPEIVRVLILFVLIFGALLLTLLLAAGQFN